MYCTTILIDNKKLIFKIFSQHFQLVKYLQMDLLQTNISSFSAFQFHGWKVFQDFSINNKSVIVVM